MKERIKKAFKKIKTENPNLIRAIISPIINRDICAVEHYYGTPTGVAFHSKLICILLSAINNKSKIIRSKDKNNLFVGKPQVTLWFANARDLPNAINRQNWLYKHSGKNIGYWAWELETMPQEESENSQLVSEIWVVSEFVASAIRRSCNIPCYVVPPPILIGNEIVPKKRVKFGLSKFLVVLDAYSSVERKNPWTAIDAFKRVFSHDKSKSLTVRVVRPEGLPDEIKSRLMKEQSPQIDVVFNTFEKAEDAREFMGKHDVYVSLHRTEGLGFNIAEAILMGLPVIATSYGGNVEFCDPHGVDLIDYDLVPGFDPQGLYKGDFVWAEPKIGDVCQAFSNLVSRSQNDIQERCEIARRAVIRHFDTEKISGKMVARLQV